jgi:hypothetical protein
MKTTRGMRRRRGLGVHAHGMARDAWRPLALRWRRGKARRESCRTRLSAAGARVTSVSHVHLHFAIAARAARIARARTGVAGAAPQVATQRIANVQSVRSRASVVADVRGHDAERRAPARVTTPVGERRLPVRVEQRHAVTRPLAMRSVTSAAPHPLRVPLALRRESARSAHGGVIGNVERSALRQRSAGATMLHFVHANAPSSAAAGQSADKPSMPTPRARPLDLAWRAPARAEGHDVSHDVESTPSSPHIHSERGAPSAASASSSAMQSPTPRALEYSQLPSALVDRLADDVLRRVERRVRIERERRGI